MRAANSGRFDGCAQCARVSNEATIAGILNTDLFSLTVVLTEL